MGRADDEAEVILDPITGKPLTNYLLDPLVVRNDEELEELDDEISGPEDLATENPERSRTGIQFIAHVNDPDDIDDMLVTLRSKWHQARKDLEFDD